MTIDSETLEDSKTSIFQVNTALLLEVKRNIVIMHNIYPTQITIMKSSFNI